MVLCGLVGYWLGGGCGCVLCVMYGVCVLHGYIMGIGCILAACRDDV